MVYLLCARDPRTGAHYRQAGHAGHYLGHTRDERVDPSINSRIQLHYAGQGAALVRTWVKDWTDKHGVFHPNDKTFVVARWWKGGDRALEKALKRRKSAPRICPMCQAEQRELHHPEDLL
jgi:hypothetical protein